MKIDLLDIETQYINNRNLNYAKKHYIELMYLIVFDKPLTTRV